MTVRELIVQLMAQPQNATVVLNLEKNELANSQTPASVRLEKAIEMSYDVDAHEFIYWLSYSDWCDSDLEGEAEDVVVIDS